MACGNKIQWFVAPYKQVIENSECGPLFFPFGMIGLPGQLVQNGWRNNQTDIFNPFANDLDRINDPFIFEGMVE